MSLVKDRVAYRKALGEHNKKMLMNIKQEELDALASAILAANRIFVAGWGRSGNVTRILSMNCSQLGLKTYVVGDNSTPSIHEGDLLVIGSGSGETETMVEIAKQCKEHGAKLALISGNAESTIGKLADVNVVIERIGAKTQAEREEVGIAFVRSYFQVVVMVCDCITSYIMDEKGWKSDRISYYHNNLE
ncbi:MAG: SIS domain-containing protein [Christensenellaceae bacterium]|jgi:6-phospho-3-hexuloisomerase